MKITLENASSKSIPCRFKNLSWRVGTLIFLAIILNTYEWKIHGLTINFERMISLPLLILVVLLLLPIRQIRLPRISAALLAMFILWSLISCLSSDVMNWSFKMWILFLSASIFYFLVILYEVNPAELFFGRIFLCLIVFLGPVIVLSFACFWIDVSLPQFIRYWFDGGLRARASFLEPNLFGSFLVVPLTGMFALNAKNRIWWWIVIIFLHATLILSFSRIPWLAYITGLCVFFVLLSPKPYSPSRATTMVLRLIIFLSIVGGGIYWSSTVDSIREIFTRAGSIQTRFYMWNLALNDIWENPIFGNGLFSLSRLHPSASFAVGSESFRSIWISNIFLAILHDTGFVGFFFFISFLYLVISRGIKTVRTAILRGNADQRMVRIGCAMIASGIAFIISGQSIPAHSLGFFWVVFAFIERVSMILEPSKNNVKIIF